MLEENKVIWYHSYTNYMRMATCKHENYRASWKHSYNSLRKWKLKRKEWRRK